MEDISRLFSESTSSCADVLLNLDIVTLNLPDVSRVTFEITCLYIPLNLMHFQSLRPFHKKKVTENQCFKHHTLQDKISKMYP